VLIRARSPAALTMGSTRHGCQGSRPAEERRTPPVGLLCGGDEQGRADALALARVGHELSDLGCALRPAASSSSEATVVTPTTRWSRSPTSEKPPGGQSSGATPMFRPGKLSGGGLGAGGTIGPEGASPIG
jgi:hypothetical protein